MQINDVRALAARAHNLALTANGEDLAGFDGDGFRNGVPRIRGDDLSVDENGIGLDSRLSLRHRQGREYSKPDPSHSETLSCDRTAPLRFYWPDLEGPMGVPMMSPETTSSTRRFFWRPAAVSF